MQDVIATHEAHQGDLYFLPAGRLHAIGAGNFLAEIQQTSDITYRVYDFGRKDAHGNPRELHIEEAKEAIDYQVWPEYRTSYDSTKPTSQLINCPYFNVNRVVVQVAAQIDFKVDSFVVVVCLWGEANINGIKVRQGETLGGIAARYGTTVAKLQRLNGLGKSTNIRAGKSIRVR